MLGRTSSTTLISAGCCSSSSSASSSSSSIWSLIGSALRLSFESGAAEPEPEPDALEAFMLSDTLSFGAIVGDGETKAAVVGLNTVEYDPVGVSATPLPLPDTVVLIKLMQA